MKAALALALPPLLAAAAAGSAGRGDAKRGAVAFQKCYACHTLEPAESISGPSLRGIIGRRVASAPGFEYSRSLLALRARARRWDEKLLDRFIADPEAVAPRTTMTFTGIKNAQERADLIAHLRRAGGQSR